MKRALAALVLVALLFAAPRVARAFCGFYVSGADKSLTNNATTVVLMRDGTHTVLSMQNAYQGPPEDFAMVVPVPTVLQKDNVKTLEREVFDKIDQLAAPRLVEYWEQDPCTAGMEFERSAMPQGQGFGAGRGPLTHADALGVTIEAEFAVGEYDIVILSAEDAAGLETWLRQNGYKMPAGAAPVLRPYVEEGTKFFVAKVDPKKITFDAHGRAMLSPLRVNYDDAKFTLPVRLGLINSGGVQDLIVHILSPETRYEVANYPNVTIPTNLDVEEGAKDKFASVYAKLFDTTLEKSPGAVVTEYAWSSNNCDPCPGPVLSPGDLATLGADVILPRTRAVPQIVPRAPTVTGKYPAEVVNRVFRRSLGNLRACYGIATEKKPDLAGDVTIKLTVGETGAPKNVSVKSSMEDPALTRCFNDAVPHFTFPKPEQGPAQVEEVVHFEMVQRPAVVPPMVLTRLHARYGKDGLGQDLVFRAAPAIVGGREPLTSGEHLEEGARPAPSNNFQARYAIRHPWTGKVSCEHPHRGVWGGPIGPTAPANTPKPTAARDLAQAPRAGVELASYFPKDPFAGGAAAKEEEEERAPAPEVPHQNAAPSTAGGCMGCAVAEAPTPTGLGVALMLGATLLVRRRVGRPERRG